jgi:3alpha(or 20beta)-hydroxysteroid dehydrogenase
MEGKLGKLDGSIALVSGGAMGMGAAHCRALASEGARVAVCDIDPEAGTSVAREVGGEFFPLDVTDQNAWTATLSAVAERLGPVTVLVNNAGTCRMKPVQDTTDEEWHSVMRLNVDAPFFGTRAVVPYMKAAGGGVIVNVSSAGGMDGAPNMAGYVTSKWALRGLTKASARDLAPFNIRVLSLHPALVRTPMSSLVDLPAATAGYPIPRPGEPEEIAQMLLFMVTGATFSTGCEFVADGGSLL